MKAWQTGLLIYGIVCIVAVLLPAPEGYNVVPWKLLIGQIYAIPAFVLTFLLVKMVRGRKTAQ